MPLAINVDRLALNPLHHEVGTTILGGPAVIDRSDAWMIKVSEDLPLGLEAAQGVLVL